MKLVIGIIKGALRGGGQEGALAPPHGNLKYGGPPRIT